MRIAPRGGYGSKGQIGLGPESPAVRGSITSRACGPVQGGPFGPAPVSVARHRCLSGAGDLTVGPVAIGGRGPTPENGPLLRFRVSPRRVSLTPMIVAVIDAGGPFNNPRPIVRRENFRRSLFLIQGRIDIFGPATLRPSFAYKVSVSGDPMGCNAALDAARARLSGGV